MPGADSPERGRREGQASSPHWEGGSGPRAGQGKKGTDVPVKDALGFGHVLPTCPGRTEVPRTLPLAPQPRASSRHEGSGDSLAPCRLAPCTPGMPGPAPQGHVSCVGEAWHCRGSAGDPGVWRSRAGQPSSYAEKLEAGKQRATWGACHPRPAPPRPCFLVRRSLGKQRARWE